jgi:hypothetical protein
MVEYELDLYIHLPCREDIYEEEPLLKELEGLLEKLADKCEHPPRNIEVFYERDKEKQNV